MLGSNGNRIGLVVVEIKEKGIDGRDTSEVESIRLSLIKHERRGEKPLRFQAQVTTR